MMLPPSVFKLRILLANFSTQCVELRHNFAVLQVQGVYGGVSDKWFTKSQSFTYGNFFTAEFVTEGYIMSYVRSRTSLFILNFSFFELRHNFAVLQDAWRVWRCVRQVVHEKPVVHLWKFFYSRICNRGLHHELCAIKSELVYS